MTHYTLKIKVPQQAFTSVFPLKFLLRVCHLRPVRAHATSSGNGTIIHTLFKCLNCVANHISFLFSDAQCACVRRYAGLKSPASFVRGPGTVPLLVHRTRRLQRCLLLASSASTQFHSRCSPSHTITSDGINSPLTTKSVSPFQFPLTH